MGFFIMEEGMMDNKCCSTRLCPVSFGFALGIVCGLWMMLLAWSSMWWGYASSMVDMKAAIYYGYAATWVGGAWGALWGLIEGFVTGLILAGFYNFFSRCCARCCKKCCATSSESCK